MERCPNCGSEDAVNIEINLETEDSVEFFQCRSCETKWWKRDGEAIDLQDVLEMTTRDERK